MAGRGSPTCNLTVFFAFQTGLFHSPKTGFADAGSSNDSPTLLQSSRISSWRIQLSLVCVCDPAYGALRAIALSIRPFALSRFGGDRMSSIQLPATDRASWGLSCVRACFLTARSTRLVFKPLINHLRACEVVRALGSSSLCIATVKASAVAIQGLCCVHMPAFTLFR